VIKKRENERCFADDPLDSYIDSVKKKLITEANSKRFGLKEQRRSRKRARWQTNKAKTRKTLTKCRKWRKKTTSFWIAMGKVKMLIFREIDFKALKKMKKSTFKLLESVDH
jgi:hypothetical protein